MWIFDVFFAASREKLLTKHLRTRRFETACEDHGHNSGLVKDYSNPIVNAPELLHSCIKSSIWRHCNKFQYILLLHCFHNQYVSTVTLQSGKNQVIHLRAAIWLMIPIKY